MKVQTLWGEEFFESRTCIKCGEEKLLTEFATRYSGNNGNCEYRNDCKDCQKHATKQVSKLRKLHPMPDIETHVCPICERNRHEIDGFKDNPKNNHPWVLDHDHETGQFRGWICSYCNVGLSRFKDNINALQRAIQYVKNGGAR